MSSGFISESEAVKVRQQRQEEWDLVRNATDPVERPEEPYDCRSLYDKLQEQKHKKDLEYEEAHKLKNMIKGLDDDEIEFLDLVDRSKLAADRKKLLEEESELNDYRSRVATLQESNLDKKLQAEISNTKAKKSVVNNKTSQGKLLQGIVIKKGSKTAEETSANRKRKATTSDEDILTKSSKSDDRKLELEETDKNKAVEVTDKSKTEDNDKVKKDSEKSKIKEDTGLKCIGILPGLGCYNDTDSSDEGSSSDQETVVVGHMDLLGRKIIKQTKE